MKSAVKILIPIDFSRHSLESLGFALSLAIYMPASYVLLHVVPPGEESFPLLAEFATVPLSRRLEEATLQLGQEAARRSLAHPKLLIETHVAVGVPFQEICHYAEREHVHLIVIGTHGRSGLPHLLIGSTAERVVQHASCPVLSVKPTIV